MNSVAPLLQTGLEAGERPHHHTLDRQFLLLCDQHVTSLMNSDATQAIHTTREGFRHHMTTHALPRGRINAQQDQPSTNGHNDPGG